MSDAFLLSGSYTANPLSPPASADFGVISQLSEALVLSDKLALSLELTSDAAMAVPFASVTNANIVVVKVVSGQKIKATITTADGAAQVVPVDSLLILESGASPVTALTLTRTPAVLTSVRVFLGQKA